MVYYFNLTFFFLKYNFTGAISTANGSALVKLGETMVICGVKAEVTVPTAEEPSKGMISMLLYILLFECFRT